MKKKRKKNHKKISKVSPVILFVVLICILLVLYNFNRFRNILGVTTNPQDQTIFNKTLPVQITPTIIVEPTAVQVIPTNIQKYIPPTSYLIPQPTNQILPTVIPTYPYTEPQPTDIPTPVNPTEPIEAIFNTEIKTVPIDAYKIIDETSSYQNTQSIIPTSIPQPIIPTPIPQSINQDNTTPQETNTITTDSTDNVTNTSISNENIVSRPFIVETKTESLPTQVIGGDTVIIANNNAKPSLTLLSHNGSTTELSDTAFYEVRKRLKERNMTVYTVKNNELLIQSDAVGALTQLPVSMDVFNDLYVNQNKIILPYRVAEFLNDTNTLNTVKTLTSNIGTIRQTIQIVERNGTTCYETIGSSKQYLFAFIPVNIDLTVYTAVHKNIIIAKEYTQAENKNIMFSFFNAIAPIVDKLSI